MPLILLVLLLVKTVGLACLTNKLRVLWVLVSNEELAELTNSKQKQKSQSHRRLLLIVVIVVVVAVGVGVVGCLGMLLGWFVGLRSY